MRILLLTEDAQEPTGGMERAALEMTQGLCARGHEVHLVYGPRTGSLLSDYQRCCTTTRWIPMVRFSLRRPLTSGWRLIRMALRLRGPFDIVLSESPYQLGLARLTARLSGAPLISHLHYVPAPTREIRFGLRGAARIIAVSDYLRTALADAGLDANRIDVVHNGYDEDIYRPAEGATMSETRRRLGIAPDALVVAYVGRVDQDKGIELLLDAWALVGDRIPKGQLLIVGSSQVSPGFDARLRATRSSASITWLPAQADIVSCYQAVDLVVLPATHPESDGRVPLESMMCGTPAIASRVGAVPENFVGELEELLFDPGDLDALAGQILRYATWRTERPDLGGRCRRHAVAIRSMAVTLDALETSFAAALAV